MLLEMEEVRKVNLPTFIGIDPFGWMARAEFVFEV